MMAWEGGEGAHIVWTPGGGRARTFLRQLQTLMGGADDEAGQRA